MRLDKINTLLEPYLLLRIIDSIQYGEQASRDRVKFIMLQELGIKPKLLEDYVKEKYKEYRVIPR